MAAPDYNQKDKLYGGFIGSLKWIIPLIAVITFGVVGLISG